MPRSAKRLLFDYFALFYSSTSLCFACIMYK